jgi:hypothetical protein|tara:strand:- start:278 stop:505 length:228 start_codon:yes stop_codon:yes gene_type:complete
MQKKIQLTGIVKEDSVTVEYETSKHDSISSAEAELQSMIDYTKSGPFPVNKVSLVKTIYNFVECYKDEMTDLKYG